MDGLTIGKAARLAGVGVETIRYYERRGLIERPPRSRSGSGYRHYTHETVKRIRFIRRAKELGFTLREIEELLALRVASETTCDDIRRRAEAKLCDVEARIASLHKIRSALEELVERCVDVGPASKCPILDVLEEGI